ncbi:hypothetical protein DFH06DRAFT_1131487 [Mycena polygramma]|nr:hypothetical protein DFH06DRAFT_1131487 [Mycena polygramma]
MQETDRLFPLLFANFRESGFRNLGLAACLKFWSQAEIAPWRPYIVFNPAFKALVETMTRDRACLSHTDPPSLCLLPNVSALSPLWSTRKPPVKFRKLSNLHLDLRKVISVHIPFTNRADNIRYAPRIFVASPEPAAASFVLGLVEICYLDAQIPEFRDDPTARYPGCWHITADDFVSMQDVVFQSPSGNPRNRHQRHRRLTGG